jgi:hypothetical protein
VGEEANGDNCPAVKNPRLLGCLLSAARSHLRGCIKDMI